MQRSFVTEMPATLAPNQVVITLPRYEIALAKAFLRRDIQKADKFKTDVEPLQVITTANQIKMFVDELQVLDKELDVTVRIPYTNFVGLGFNTTGDAVSWAQRFVSRYYPTTEERLLKRQLLSLPLSKTEIVWLGGEKFRGFVEAVATSPSTEEMVAVTPSATPPQLTMEEVQAKRAAIAARQAAKKNGIKGVEA